MMMSKAALISVFGLAGVAAAMTAQGCSNSSSPSPASNQDSGTSTNPMDSGTQQQPHDSGASSSNDSGGSSTTDSGGSSNVDAGAWAPSNVPAATLSGLTGVAVQIGAEMGAYNSCTADTSKGTWACNGNAPMAMGAQFKQSGAGGNAYVWVLSSLSIDNGYSLDVQGTQPGIIVVTGDVSIGGTVTTEAGQQAGTDGAQPANGESGMSCDDNNFISGGGGAFCGAGGSGLGSADAGPDASGPGGMPYGTANLIPLLTGGAGGACNGGGTGGGALQISAYGSLTVLQGGSIAAVGSEGNEYGMVSGGGGAGGAILLESPSVAIAGTISVNGGSGGDSTNNGNNGTVGASGAPGGGQGGGQGSGGATINGGDGNNGTGGDFGAGGGGAGWIRINTVGQPTISGGILSPSATTSCYSVGTLGM